MCELKIYSECLQKIGPKKYAELKKRNYCVSYFKRRLTSEIRNFWLCRTSLEYSERWWRDVEAEGKSINYISEYPGDDSTPFSSISISPSDYIAAKDDVLWSLRGNAITNIVTAFETYLYGGTKRAIFLNPAIMENSGIEFSAGDIGKSFDEHDPRIWFSEEIVKKYIRNKSHGEMIKKIDALIKGGIWKGQADLIARWVRKVTLRNALIHNAKLVNEELINAWPNKFLSIGSPIQLEDGDVIKSHFVAYELATLMDQQFIRTTVCDEDAKLLARVAYLCDREQTIGQIADIVSKVLNHPIGKKNVESAIAYQKRTRERIPDFTAIQELVIN
ncbi:hypothetical protein [Pseudovibrio sp. SCP19]|uniref:hypothetical protein n=1 Tax=Pseudovibrio sp. SCP19 TaxID=3141374 RepID=UPI00333B5C4A